MTESGAADTVRIAQVDAIGQSREDLIDDMALPFLELAEKIEAAKVNNADEDTWTAIFETNLFLWRFIANFLPRHFSEDVTSETSELLEKISVFMTKVTIALSGDPEKDTALIEKVVQLNLKMCDQILAMRGR